MNFKLIFLSALLALILSDASESSAQYMGNTGSQQSLEECIGCDVGKRNLNDEIGGGSTDLDPDLYPQYALDCYPYTHQWSVETQSCEIWWNSVYVAVPILVIIPSTVIILIFMIVIRRK